MIGARQFMFRVGLNKRVLGLGVFMLSLFFTACPKDSERPNARVTTSNTARQTSTVVPEGVAFNGERAMEHVKKQLAIGPRVAGSPELARTRDYIIKTLTDFGIKVRTDEFTATTPFGEKQLVNVTAEIPGESQDVIIIASHYDTKLYKDMRFLGANDPGTSVATLMELGRVLSASRNKPQFTYWLVFFDGEEAFCEGWEQCQIKNQTDPSKPLPDNTYGSRHYVSQLQSSNEISRVRALILLDMMGAKNLELGRDPLSTRWLQDIVWRAAAEKGYGKYFVERPEGVGGDDYDPFLSAGIASLDLIQLTTYPYWHRADDTIDKVSADSMKIVGEVVLASLPKIAERVQSHPGTTKSKP